MSFVRTPSPSSNMTSGAIHLARPGQKSPKPSEMMRIQSLLNPSSSGGWRYSDTATNNGSFPSTSACSAVNSPPQQSDEPATPTTVSTINRDKKDPDKSFFGDSSPRRAVNYPPHELHEQAICLSRSDHDEFYRQHKLFKIKPSASDGQGLISDNTRYIPYSSEKKSFFGKTGREGFNVFQYTFQLPDEADGKVHTVMWDYENGLVRITPFFKACKYSKTTPAKALISTPHLKDLAHSITGGALAAQGYWLPYECARAICLTFAYKIRWALVHIFGPSFVRECLPPTHKNFGKFTISSEVVRCSELVAEGWKTASPKQEVEQGGIPRSVPQGGGEIGRKELRPRAARPVFREGSPFDSDGASSTEVHGYRIATPGLDFVEALSPKSSPHGSGWTSINPPNTPVSRLTDSPTIPLTNSLLTQPRFAPWRPDNTAGAIRRHTPKMPTGAHDRHRMHKRRRSPATLPNVEHDPRLANDEEDLLSYADISDSESDDVDIPLPRKKGRKRARYHVNSNIDEDEDERADSSGTIAPPSPRPAVKAKTRGLKSKKYTAEDARAAKLLLGLHLKDADLAMGPDGVVRKPMGF